MGLYCGCLVGDLMDDINFQTPVWVCDEMVKLIPSTSYSILEPTPGAGNLSRAVQYRFGNTKVMLHTPKVFEKWYRVKIDCIIANPPFTPMSKGYELLSEFFEISNYIIILMPWLSLINSEKRTAEYVSRGLKTIIHLPRRAFSGSRVQTCIMVFEKGYRGKIELKLIGD